MIKRIIFIVLMNVVLDSVTLAQSIDSARAHRKLIKEFYSCLLNRKFVSMERTSKIIASSYETEEYLFFQKCHKAKTEEECLRIGSLRFSDPANYESLLFLEFKKWKNKLVPSESNQIDKILSKVKIRPGGGAVEVPFSKGVVIFTLSNQELDKFRITDIFLPDGSSIFNFIGTGTHDKHYYK